MNAESREEIEVRGGRREKKSKEEKGKCKEETGTKIATQVGDRLTDMEVGKAIGATTILVQTVRLFLFNLVSFRFDWIRFDLS